MKTIYIASEMTGLKREVWFENFSSMELALKMAGFKVLNPAKFDPMVDNPEWKHYIMDDIDVLVDNADTICLFGKWYTSPGAIIEWMTAIRNDIDVWYFDTPFLLKIVFKLIEKKLRKKIEKAD